MLDAVELMPPSELPHRIAELRQAHRDLDEEILRLVERRDADELAIKRMKKRKLQLKDQISLLESSLIPDEPA